MACATCPADHFSLKAAPLNQLCWRDDLQHPNPLAKDLAFETELSSGASAKAARVQLYFLVHTGCRSTTLSGSVRQTHHLMSAFTLIFLSRHKLKQMDLREVQRW